MNKLFWYHGSDLTTCYAMIKQICYEWGEENGLSNPFDLNEQIEEAQEIVKQYVKRSTNPNLQQFPSAHQWWEERLKMLLNKKEKLYGNKS